jgi:hypothetical protein
MATHSAARRNRTLVALMGGFVVFVGMGLTAPAFADDDDDWHTEATRPVGLQQQLQDKVEIQAAVPGKPSREQVYGSPTMAWVPPAIHPTPTAYETATVDRPHR